MQRRLAAVLAADVVGYSRLMGTDEIGTITSLKSHRRELVDSGIAEHRGRIVKTTGDGMLVEFASVVDAVSCAVHIQRSMVRRNVTVPADKRIIFMPAVTDCQIARSRMSALMISSAISKRWSMRRASINSHCTVCRKVVPSRSHMRSGTPNAFRI
jgi:hypothetical protein